MGYKTIVAVLQDEAGASAVLDVAVALAADSLAHLIGVHAEPLPMPIASPMGFPDATIIGTGEGMNQNREEKLQRLFDERMRRESVSAEWRSLRTFSGDSALSALESARCGDIVLAGASQGDGGSPDIDTLIQSGGRPVLVVPTDRPANVRPERVVLAWNGSREAARAAFDALPFMLTATETVVLTVNPVKQPGEAGALPGNEIAAALARHGAKVTVESATSGSVSIAGTISRVVADRKADLLVAGAFSHSRLKEMFFGGTTRSLIENPPCLTLMAR